MIRSKQIQRLKLILVVDDQEIVRDALEVILGSGVKITWQMK